MRTKPITIAPKPTGAEDEAPTLSVRDCAAIAEESFYDLHRVMEVIEGRIKVEQQGSGVPTVGGGALEIVYGYLDDMQSRLGEAKEALYAHARREG